MTSRLIAAAGFAVALAVLFDGAPASACLPPPPGRVEPTLEQQVRGAAMVDRHRPVARGDHGVIFSPRIGRN